MLPDCRARARSVMLHIHLRPQHACPTLQQDGHVTDDVATSCKLFRHQQKSSSAASHTLAVVATSTTTFAAPKRGPLHLAWKRDVTIGKWRRCHRLRRRLASGSGARHTHTLMMKNKIYTTVPVHLRYALNSRSAPQLRSESRDSNSSAPAPAPLHLRAAAAADRALQLLHPPVARPQEGIGCRRRRQAGVRCRRRGPPMPRLLGASFGTALFESCFCAFGSCLGEERAARLLGFGSGLGRGLGGLWQRLWQRPRPWPRPRLWPGPRPRLWPWPRPWLAGSRRLGLGSRLGGGLGNCRHLLLNGQRLRTDDVARDDRLRQPSVWCMSSMPE